MVAIVHHPTVIQSVCNMVHVIMAHVRVTPVGKDHYVKPWNVLLIALVLIVLMVIIS
jgi:hypothetical protein